MTRTRLLERTGSRLSHMVLLAALGVGLGLAGAGCGDDGSGSKDETPPEGEPCMSPGLTSNDCVCSGSGIAGSRTCGQDGIWGACFCPDPLPDGALCREGQQLQCPPCPGEAQGRVIRCTAGGMFDCSCGGDDAGASDASTAGDASTLDASTAGDAG